MAASPSVRKPPRHTRPPSHCPVMQMETSWPILRIWGNSNCPLCKIKPFTLTLKTACWVVHIATRTRNATGMFGGKVKDSEHDVDVRYISETKMSNRELQSRPLRARGLRERGI